MSLIKAGMKTPAFIREGGHNGAGKHTADSGQGA